MKAVVVSAYGEPEVLELREVAEPPLGANEVKVRMAGASVNPIDWKARSGALKAWIPLELPAIIGKDAAGEVVEVGAGVTAFKRGDRVMGFVNHGYAELVVAPVEAWAEVPATLDLVEAGALPLVLLTGAELVDAIKPEAGSVMLVTGALGSVGRVAVFCAKALGVKVWAGVRGSHAAQAAELGVAGVVALDDPAAVAKLPELDSIAHTIGGDIAPLLAKVKAGGKVGSVVGEPAGAKERGLTVHATLTRPNARRLAELGRAVADGKLVVPIAKKLPLAQAAAAHRLAEGGAGGKVVLTGA